MQWWKDVITDERKADIIEKDVIVFVKSVSFFSLKIISTAKYDVDLIVSVFFFISSILINSMYKITDVRSF